jgi:hypothetical protein
MMGSSGKDPRVPLDLDIERLRFGSPALGTSLAQIYPSCLRNVRVSESPIVLSLLFCPSLELSWTYHDQMFRNLRKMCGQRSRQRNTMDLRAYLMDRSGLFVLRSSAKRASTVKEAMLGEGPPQI